LCRCSKLTKRLVRVSPPQYVELYTLPRCRAGLQDNVVGRAGERRPPALGGRQRPDRAGAHKIKRACPTGVRLLTAALERRAACGLKPEPSYRDLRGSSNPAAPTQINNLEAKLAAAEPSSLRGCPQCVGPPRSSAGPAILTQSRRLAHGDHQEPRAGGSVMPCRCCCSVVAEPFVEFSMLADQFSRFLTGCTGWLAWRNPLTAPEIIFTDSKAV
jgi:hypothetical protein